MEVEIGTVVRSLQGRDEGFFVVLKKEDGFWFLADGKNRPLEKPKRKNPRHVAPTRTVLNMERVKTNKALREALKPFYEGETASRGGKTLG